MQKSAPFTIYNASAGSGKTFKLAQNYISHLLLAPGKFAYQNILAITFTNKAVAEMKQRIITSLRDFSQPEIPEKSIALFKNVQQQTGLSTEDIQKRTQKILKTILHNYAGFEISTIDSFNQRILKTFAKDLKIPVNFEVELDTDQILQEAVDRVISKVGKDKIITNALIDFAITKVNDDKSWDISNDLNEIAKLLVNENNFQALEKIRDKNIQDFAKFKEELIIENTQLKKLAQSKAQEFFDLIQQENLENEDFSRSSLPNFLKKVLDGKNPEVTGAGWREDVKNGKVAYPKRIGAKGAIIERIQPEITEIYTCIESALLKIELLKKILKKNPSLSLLAAIREEVNTIKDERSLLLISEFNKTIHESIKNQPVPFIYERLGEWYKTYFIDEFQDTSELQWENIQPLIEHSLSSGEGQLTLLGDAKQSIYRWRGGKAEQFIELCQAGNPFYVDKEIKPLDDNWRSDKEIVNFNNRFFEYAKNILENKFYQDIYQQAFQNAQKDEAGYVNIRFIEAKNAEERDEKHPEEVFKILQSLKQTNSDDYLNGVCILVRKRKEGVAIAQYLSEHQIPIISSETLLLQNSKEVNFLISLLRLDLNPSDGNYKFEVLDYLYDKIQPEETNYHFIQSRLQVDNPNFFKTLEDFDINFNFKKFDQLPIYDAIEYSLRSFHLIEKADAYLQFFLDFVYEYIQSNTEGINGLLELWELKKDKLSISVPEGQNAVQILTIHKAKGLEFPTVIYPYANPKFTDTSKDNIWIDLKNPPNSIPIAYIGANKGLEKYKGNISKAYQTLKEENALDAMNVAYVAMTRPQNQLYIISEAGKNYSNHLSELLIDFLKKEGKWEDENTIYEYGQKKIQTSSKDVESETIKDSLHQFISTNPSSHNIDIVTKSGSMWDTHQEKAIEEGNIIHDLLSEIYTQDDLENAISNAISRGLIRTDEREKYFNKFGAVVFHPQLMPFFASGCEIFTEKEIIINHEIKRLDRLCIIDNKAVIIDYKTGKFKKKHERQIQEYANAIQEMGYQIFKKLLIYFEEEGIEIKSIT